MSSGPRAVVRSRTLLLALAAWAMLLLIACSGSANACHPIGVDEDPATHHGCGEPRPEAGEMPSAADLAIADLSARLAIDPATIVVGSVEEVTWRDSSIGCPEPDRAYLQVLTPGQRILLDVDGVRYEYHTDRGDRVVYCENPQPALGG